MLTAAVILGIVVLVLSFDVGMRLYEKLLLDLKKELAPPVGSIRMKMPEFAHLSDLEIASLVTIWENAHPDLEIEPFKKAMLQSVDE